MSDWVERDSSGRLPRPQRGLVRLGVVCVLASSVLGGVLVQGARASAAAEGIGVTISGNAPGLLSPGQAATALNLAFANSNDDDATISGLSVAIVSVTAPHATAQLPCTAANYTVSQFTGSQSFSVPPGSSTLLSRGFAQSTWPAVAMLETHQNQDGCAGATVKLAYSASGQDGSQPSAPAASSSGGGPAGSPPAGPNAAATTTTTSISTPAAAPRTRRATTAPRTPRVIDVKDPSVALTPRIQSVPQGGNAEFTVTLRNTSGVRLTSVAVSDPLAPDCARSIGTLAAGAALSYGCARPGVQAAFLNAATLSGRPESGAAISATATARVTLIGAALTPPVPQPSTPTQQPGIAINTIRKTQTLTTRIITHKTLNSSKTTTGYGNAHFDVKVTNTGNVSLRTVTVADELAAGCDRSIGTLAAGATRSYRCIARSVRKSFTNAAVATGMHRGRVTATSSAGVKVKTTRSVILTLTIPDVLFAFNRSILRPRATHALMVVRNALTVVYPVGHVTVTGDTDNVGTVSYNVGLSERRATSVATWLERHGIPTRRISIAWNGEADPVASNATALGRSKNRRVTISLRMGH